MADKTKAELEAENVELRKQTETLIKQIEDGPFSSDANYQKEFTRLNAKHDKVAAEFEAYKVKVRDEKLERESIANDAKAAEEKRLAEFGIVPDQSAHTRFRVSQRPPSGQRDIFGDPTTPVFNIGVELHGYYGGLYIPVQTVVEMAQSIGMLTTDQANDLNLELTETKAKIEFAGEYAQELVDGITSHVDQFYRNLNSVVGVGAGDVSDTESDDSNSGESAGQAHDSNVGKESDGVSNGAESDKQPSLFGSLK